MAPLTDDSVGQTLDYLGRGQPLASQQLTSLPSGSAGGGAVGPPVTGAGRGPGPAGAVPLGSVPPRTDRAIYGPMPGEEGLWNRSSMPARPPAAPGMRELFSPILGAFQGSGAFDFANQTLHGPLLALLTNALRDASALFPNEVVPGGGGPDGPGGPPGPPGDPTQGVAAPAPSADAANAAATATAQGEVGAPDPTDATTGMNSAEMAQQAMEAAAAAAAEGVGTGASPGPSGATGGAGEGGATGGPGGGDSGD